jgi:hypothetical protein
MSALGQKQTFCDAGAMSALPPKADIGGIAIDSRLRLCLLPEWRALIQKGGIEMKASIVQRINRKLAAKGQILKIAHPWMKMKLHCGDYYILDLSGNVIVMDIDPEELARKLGVLKEGEKVKRRSRKTRPKS